ncbi:MAG: amidohydrolase [Flavobacteriales bacterium]
MNSLRTLTVFSLLLISCYCGAQNITQVYHNGKIYSANAEQEFHEAMALEGSTIFAIGSDDVILDLASETTELIDLQQKVVLPGLHDTHIHLLEASSEAAAACTLDGSNEDPYQLAEELWNCAPTANDNGWIFAFGHSIFALLDPLDYPKDILDDYFPTIPLVIMEETSHSAWVNSAALTALSINGSTPDPEGGHIVKEDGVATGLLLDSAGDLAFEMALETNENIEELNYEGLLNFGLPTMAMNGITSIGDGRTYWKRNFVETWQELNNNNELTVRAVLSLWAYPQDDDAEQIQALTNMHDDGDNFLKINQIKLYVDGITTSGTAALDQPYVFNFGWPFNQGLNYFSQERLSNYITVLEEVGYDFHIHAIGNRGVHEALNAIENARIANGDIGARHRITHLEMVNTADLPRFAQLDVCADVQVSGFWTQPEFWSENDVFVGEELANNLIPLASFEQNGAKITLSSDWDVSTFNPFVSIQNALTRSPQNMATVQNAVDAKTINSAYALGQNQLTGSLEPGKAADFICLNQDIFEIPLNQIESTSVDLTVFNGEQIYISDSFPINIAEQAKVQRKTLPTISSGVFNITVDSAQNMQIMSTKGSLLMEVELNHGAQQINLDSLPEGMYLLHFADQSIERIFLSR